MAEPGLISVVIPAFNARLTIKRCIESVIKTEYKPLEIIVVDDCSTDNTLNLVEELDNNYPDVIKIIRHERNSGPAKARNTGASQARGEYIFFVDSDTEMLPDALANFTRRIPEADAVSGIYHPEPLNPGWVPLYKALLTHYLFSRDGLKQYEGFQTMCAGIRTQEFRESGGFNESLSWGMDYEAEEFGYRFSRHHKVLLDPTIMVRHRFPGLVKCTTTYFFRVMLWMEVFLRRKKFESAGTAQADTGFATMALLIAFLSIPAVLISPWFLFVTAGCSLIYLYGYAGFFLYVWRTKPWFTLGAIISNLYFTLVLASGACWGIVKVISGNTKVIVHK